MTDENRKVTDHGQDRENNEASAERKGPPLDRRQFLGGVGGITAGAVAGGAGTLGALSAGADELAPGLPENRRNDAFQVRHQAAVIEHQYGVPSVSFNGDEDKFPNRIGNYSKGLPHDSVTGEVDQAAYNQLLSALESGDFNAMNQVPTPGALNLLNPLGGLGFNMIGPDGRALPAPPPPSVESAELAAQAAELYWMAVLRDVPFVDYDTDPLVQQACDDLNNQPGYTGPVDPNTGDVTPQVLFRWDAPGVTTGPIVSQLLLFGYDQDGVLVNPVKIRANKPGEDFLTDYDEWIDSRSGFPSGNPGFFGARDPVQRFPRNARDLGLIAGSDDIHSAYIRAALVLRGLFNVFLDPASPYIGSPSQTAFATLGFADFMSQLGAAPQGERVTWYSKWQLHRFLRPEDYGGLVHRVIEDGASYPIHPAILNSPVLPLVFAQNQARNQARGLPNVGTYLLPQMFRSGCPTHPSYPAGHAYSAGACITVFKAWLNEDAIFPIVRVPSADGLGFVPYSGPPVTIGGELNKLAHNLSFGRDMSGVHWRADDESGLEQGEAWSIRFLSEAARTYPEPFDGWNLTKFDGTRIVITGDGDFPA